MDSTTRRQRKPHTGRTVRAQGSGAGRAAVSSGTRSIQRGSSTANQRATKPQRPGDGANLVIAGAVIAIAGLAWALGLALTSGGPGTGDRHLLLKLAPWFIILGGLALTVYGFMRLKPTIRA